MSRQKKDLLFWFTVFGILVGQIILIWALIQNSANLLEALAWIIGAVLPAIGFLYNQIQKRSLRLFLFTQKLRSRFSTTAPTWNMSAIMRSEYVTNEALEQIIERLNSLRVNGRDIQVKHVNANSRTVYISSGPTLEITYTPPRPTPVYEMGDETLPYIRVSIKNYRVGYAQTEYAIRREIAPILETIANVTQDVDTRYSLVIEFDKNKNPFFGLYIAQLPPESVSKFSIRLSIADYSPNDTVLISESQVAINTRTQASLQDLAIEFLSFNSSLQEHLSSV